MTTEALHHQIPMLSRSAVDLLAVGPADPGYLERVLDVASRDPALTTMALHLANSSAFSGEVAIPTLEQAVMRIGARRFVTMVLSSHLVQVFVPASEEMARLWRHAATTSVAARCLAGVWPRLEIHPDWAATAGLIHNLGAMLLAVHQIEPYRHFLAGQDLDDDGIVEAERAVFGSDHQHVGAKAAERMCFPDALVEVVRGHHGAKDAAKPLVRIVHAATRTVAWDRARMGNGARAAEERGKLLDLMDSAHLPIPDDGTFERVFTTIRDETRLEIERLGIPLG